MLAVLNSKKNQTIHGLKECSKICLKEVDTLTIECWIGLKDINID